MARDPNLDRLISVLSAPPAAPAQPQGVSASDYAKQLAGGATQAVGYGLRGIGEVINAPARSEGRDSRSLLIDASPLINAGNRIAAKGDTIQSGISEAAKQRITGSTPEGELLHPSTYSLGNDPSVSGYALQAANVLGQVAPTLATGALTKGELVPSAGVAAALGGGAAGQQEEQRIQQLPQAELDKVPAYQKLISEGATPEQARASLGTMAGSRAALTTMPVSALSALTEVLPFTGKFQNALGKVVGPSRVARAGTGAVVDALGEGVQEAAEQSAQTLGANSATGENRSLGEDTFQNFLLGAIGGAPLGAVGGLAHGGEHQAETAVPDATEAAPAPAGQAEEQQPAAPAPEPVASTPAFTPTQNPITQEVQVAPGVVVHEDDGPLSRSLVEGAKQGALDRPGTTALSDGSVIDSSTGELLGPPQQDLVDMAQKATNDAAKAAEKAAPKSSDTTASVPFMLTAQMRRDLTARGFDRQTIARMSPQQAVDVLQQPTPAPTTAAEEEKRKPTPSELDAIVSGYYDTFGSVDAQTMGLIARRFGVQRQAVADAKRRVNEAAAASRATTQPAQPSLELGASPAPNTQESSHEAQRNAGQAGQEVTSEGGAQQRQGQQGGTQGQGEVGGAGIAAEPVAGGDSGHAAGTDSEAGQRSHGAAGTGGQGSAGQEGGSGGAPAVAVRSTAAEAEAAPVAEPVRHEADNAAGQVQLSAPAAEGAALGESSAPDRAQNVAPRGVSAESPGSVASGKNVGVDGGAGIPESGKPAASTEGVSERWARMPTSERAAVLDHAGLSDRLSGSGFDAIEKPGQQRIAKAITERDNNVAPVKWFGTQAKADAYVTKNALASSHEVVQEGRRFEVRPKKAAAPAKEPAALGDDENSRLHASAEYTSELPGKQKQGVPAAELAVSRDDDGNYRYAQGSNTGTTGSSHSFRSYSGWHSPAFKTAEAARAGGLDAIEKGLPKKAGNLAEAGQIKKIREWIDAERAKLTPTPKGGKSSETDRVLNQWVRDQQAAGRAPTSEQIAARRVELEKPASANPVQESLKSAVQVDHLTPAQLDQVSAILDRGAANRGETKAKPSNGEVFEQFPTEAKAKAFAATLEGGSKITSHHDNKMRQVWTVQGSDTSPSATIAAWVKARLNAGDKITTPMLSKVANDAFGGTQTEGKYSIKDAYDALELGVNQWILAHPAFSPAVSADDAVDAIKVLQNKMDNQLPTQTKRTAEMDEFQQFSTHPAFAYLANWAANITSDDSVLEPSAGIGGLAVFAKLAGADVTVNEFSERRAAVLRELGFPTHTENAEQLNNVMPADVKPTVIVMNPPFSSTAGRMQGQRSTSNGAKHIEQALARLEPGGRLVAIVGNGMDSSRPAFKSWWDGIKAKYTVRANIGLPGKEYAKYGTTFDNNLLVIDKNGPTTAAPVTGTVATVADAVPLLETIHERQGIERTEAPQRASAESESQNAAGAAEGAHANGQPAPAEPAGLGAGKPENGRGVSGEGAGGARPGERAADAGEGAAGVRPADRKPRRGSADQRVEPVGADAASSSGEADAGSGEPGGVVIQQRDAGEQERAGGKVNADSTFEGYAPQRLSIPGSKPHPGKLVQSAAMAAVLPPVPRYTPNLPKSTITEGKLSDAQLESIVYAGQAHETRLADGARRGYFIGDGTGVGKGREIGGIILDNLRQGRKKALWISEKSGLLDDAKRDYKGVGGDPAGIFLQGKTKASDAITAKDGVLFTTYATLRSGESKSRTETSTTKPKTRLEQIVEWLGKDFDGVIAFDEAHNMGNAIAMKGKRGKTDPSSQALAGVELQRLLPNARVVYVSATGATEVSNLSYATRLGLWGAGTAFPSAEHFINSIHSGGLAAMELVSRDMKQMGAYMARSLSFDGVTYDRVEHKLDQYQHEIYNELAKAWQITLRNVHEALQLTGVTGAEATNGRAKEAALSAFWGTQQRFFNQVLTAMQMPTVIDAIRADLAAGRSVVMQLVNTNEAALNRAIAALGEDSNLEDLDLTPRDALLQYVRNSFPVQQFESYADENGNLQSRPVVDSKGEPVFNKEAIAAREQLLQNLEHIRVPDGPLEMLLDAFGADAVAEITGRRSRVVRERNADGQMVRVQQKRSNSSAKADADAFQAGKKRLLVFSDAGGTGYSFHSDLTAKNQQQRAHYLLQPGWRADKAVQGFGRTHRSNEANQPIYRLATTDLPAHKRFISTIARRLDQLGALTKGQRDAGSKGLISEKDNLESPYASAAIESLFRDMYNNRIPDMPFGETTQLLGFDRMVDKDGALNDSKIPSVPQFLNRLLSLPTDMQGVVFDAFTSRMESRVQQAINAGTLDTGMETIKALKTRVVSEQPVYTDPDSGATTNYVELELEQSTHIQRFPESNTFSKYSYVRNAQSGRVWAVKDSGTITGENGKIRDRVQLYNPTSSRVEDKTAIQSDKFVSLTPKEAEALWDAESAAAPKTYTEKSHLVTGALLPIWDRLKGHVRVVRVLADDGRRYLGRQINSADLNATLKSLGATSSESQLSPAEVQKAVMGGKAMELANGWVLERKTVNNEQRMEIMRFPAYDNAQQRELARVGGFIEKIQWQPRAFLPTGAKGVEALTALTARNPVVGPVDAGTQSVDFSKAPAGTAAEQAPKAGLNAATLSAAVTRQVAKWKNAPVVRVVASANDLPSYVRAAPGFDASVEAVHDRGAIYLIADRLASATRASQVLAHEAIGHYGVEQILGKQGFASVRDQIVKLRADGKMADLFKEIDQRYGMLDNDTLAAETMAVMAEKGMRNGIMARVMAAFRQFLRTLGFHAEFSEGDLRQIITNAGRWLESGRARPMVAVRGVSFADGGNASTEAPKVQLYRQPADLTIPLEPEHDGGTVFGQNPYFVNNASGESSASVEAQNRLRDEKEAGQIRMLIDRDGSVRPLYGVDAVDTVAGQGQIIVQRGVGKGTWSVIGRDMSMSRDLVAGKFNAARMQLRTEAEEMLGRVLNWTQNDAMLPQAVFSKRPAGAVADDIERAATWSITDIVPFMRDKREDWRPGWLGLLTLRQLAEVAGKYLPRIQQYTDTVQAMLTRRTGLQAEAAGIADSWWKWQRKNRKESEVLASIMHDATLAGVDPAEPFVPGSVTLVSGEVVPMTTAAVTRAAADLEERAKGAPEHVANILRGDAARLREALGVEQSRREAHPALKARYDAMSTEARNIYTTVRDAYAARADAMQKALIDRIAGLEISASERKALSDRVRAHFESARVQSPYFPLARFGDYWVSAEKPDGSKEFRMMENRGQQRRVQEAYTKAGWTTKAGAKIDMARAIDGASASFMANVSQTLAENGVDKNVSDEIYQLYLRTLPELSVRKQFIHRKGVAGYDNDVLRAFSAHMNHGAYQLARLENSHKMEATLRGLRQDVKALADEGGIEAVKAARVMSEVDKRHEWIMNPKDAAWVQKLSAANFAYYLGATPAAALVNMTQGAVVTFPALASRYGWAKALGELMRATQQSIRTYGHVQKLLTGDELRAHQELVAQGAIDLTLSHNLAGMSEGDVLSYNPVWRNTMKVLSHGFHKAEVFNREGAGLAAYRLARGAGESHEAAVKYAADTIYQTHFDYSNANRARFMQSNGAKVLFAFKQYSQHMSYWLWRNLYQSISGATKQEKSEARRKLVGTLGMTAVFSGAMGLPLMTMAFAVANAFNAAFGDDNEPWDAETEFRNFLVETFGPTFGRIAQVGPVQASTGLAIADRTKLDQMWFRPSDQELEGRAQYDYLLEQIAGPIGGMGANLFRANQLYQDGHLWRGVETAMPKVIKDAIKTIRYANEGVNNLRGDPVVSDPSPYELLMQTAGFSPARVSEQYNANNSLKDYEGTILKRRQALMDAYAMGIRMRDQDMVQSVTAKIEAFNASNPAVGITANQIRRSLQARERYSERAANGVVLNPKLAAQLKARVSFAAESGE